MMFDEPCFAPASLLSGFAIPLCMHPLVFDLSFPVAVYESVMWNTANRNLRQEWEAVKTRRRTMSVFLGLDPACDGSNPACACNNTELRQLAVEAFREFAPSISLRARTLRDDVAIPLFFP